jgi:glycerol-3-phosphate dehydrogenase
LSEAARYLARAPSPEDVLSAYSGLRPLVRAGATQASASISREHTITVSPGGLVTITGGKWTTYRKMAEDVVNIAAINNMLPAKNCITKTLPIHGAQATADYTNDYYYYGSDWNNIELLTVADASLSEKIHERLPYTKAMILWAVQQEMCMTIEDALSRRTRALLLDARAAMEAAPEVGAIIANELKKDDLWIKNQVDAFNSIAKNYLPV